LQAGITDRARPGGANTSHTIAVELLSSLLAAVPPGATRDSYLQAATEANVLARSTVEGRRRTVRYLRELYMLDTTRTLFRALRDLWDEEEPSRPLIAGLCAYARDSVFRASAGGVLPLAPGSRVSSEDLTRAVVEVFPDVYNEGTAAKIGRNTASSWTQTGHLAGRQNKVRTRVVASPASVTYALLLGHLEGRRGQSLFDTEWTGFLDTSPSEVASMTEAASRRGYLELRSAGGVVEIGFRHLLRPGLGDQV